MKIGILIDRLNVGGVEKIALEEVKALRKIGEDAYLLVLRKKGVVNDAFPDLQKQVPIIFLDDRLPNFLKVSFSFPIFHFFSFFHISYPLLIPFILKKREYDYLIVHGTYTAFTAIAIKWIKGIPFSAFIWDPITYIVSRVYSKNIPSYITRILLFIANLLDKLILINTHYILTGGKAHNLIFRKLNPNKEIIEITPGVHPINKINLQDKKDYILMVTAWKRGKNPDYIFELLNRLPNLKFKLVGKWIDSKYKYEFEKKIKKLNYSKNISIIGEVSETVLNNFYQEALFLLQINDDRGFGMPAMEAAANGTTFIIPKGQGVCKLFAKNIEGFYVKEMDTKQIVKSINLLYQNRKLMYQMGHLAWRRTNKLFSWSEHSIKLMKIINRKKIEGE